MFRALFLLVFGFFATASYAEEWALKKLSQTETTNSETDEPAPNGLPDGFVARNDEVQLPTRAWYEKPTDKYRHGALGDDIEAGQLTVQVGSLKTGRFVHELPVNQVFEDRTPRAVDLDGFGKASIVTILTDVNQGASVAVFGSDKQGANGSGFKLVAQTPYIGRSNRWLNIAGIDDFDGSGSSSIALVETPHIGGKLQFWRWSKGKLTLIAEKRGFSNHKNGSREQRLSAVEDFDNDGVSDLALPADDRSILKLIKLTEEKEIKEIASITLPSPIDKAIGVSREADDVVLTVGLEDGSVWAIHK